MTYLSEIFCLKRKKKDYLSNAMHFSIEIIDLVFDENSINKTLTQFYLLIVQLM